MLESGSELVLYENDIVELIGYLCKQVISKLVVRNWVGNGTNLHILLAYQHSTAGTESITPRKFPISNF